MTTTFSRVLTLVAAYTERYVLSVVFLCLAAKEVRPIRGIWSGQYRPETTVSIDVAHHLILLLLGLFTGLMLLLARRPTVPPQQLKLILVPLATTFYYLIYYAVPSFPAAWQMNFCPVSWQKPFMVAGLTCVITGPVIALWGLSHLRRSFGIYVTVREVVLTGPYQWVRHPMYLGGFFLCLGVGFANFSVAYFLLVAIHISLLIYRAHLEETNLSKHSAEYREYMKRTGFLFPRLRPQPRLAESRSGGS
jgi:protein-S-isoprenylcysteine O-methyltransferase Ste14